MGPKQPCKAPEAYASTILEMALGGKVSLALHFDTIFNERTLRSAMRVEVRLSAFLKIYNEIEGELGAVRPAWVGRMLAIALQVALVRRWLCAVGCGVRFES